MNEKRSLMMESTPIGKLIWKLSIPSMIGILTYNLYHIVDTIFVSRGVGMYAAGGLAISFPLYIFLTAITSTMGAGAASIISRALGKKDVDKASKVAANTFVVFWTIALIVTVAGIVYLEDLLYMMGVTEKLLPYARDYTKIILIGAITSTGFSSLIRAEGSSKYAMFQWIIPIIANLILDPIFIFTLQLGIKGAAIATVLSQCLSAGIFLHYFFFSKKTQLQFKIQHFLPDAKIVIEILTIGIPSFIQIASQSMTIIIVNNVLREYGQDLDISSYGFVNKVMVFLLLPFHGIVQGIQPIIGYNYGAQIKVRVRETLRTASIMAGIYGVGISLLVFFLSEFFIYPFTSDLEIIQMGREILKIICLGIVFSGVHMMQTAYFQAIGKVKISFVLSFCNYILCFVPSVFLLSALFGLNGVWYSFPLSSIIALGISSICLVYQNRRDVL